MPPSLHLAYPAPLPPMLDFLDDDQTHLIYLLLDSNLPTGGFVASSGLESWAKHGFLGNHTGYNAPSPPAGPPGSRSNGGGGVGNSAGPTVAAKRVTEFLDAEVENYARSTGMYVRRGWQIVSQHLEAGPDGIDHTLQRILSLDTTHESTLLSHVSRRASKAQGVAILTLFTKGLSRPPGFDEWARQSGDGMPGTMGEGGGTAERDAEREGEGIAAAVIEGYKRLIRKGVAPGHLAVCWGVMTAGLGLSLVKSYHLYLFLHARSLLSAAVRLNLIGPYLSSQLLLHPVRAIVERYDTVGDASEGWGADEGWWCGGESREDDDSWRWIIEAESGPSTTWPLGEVLMARHDLQHSRIFNS